MSLVFRICTLSVVIGLSACSQSDDHESAPPPPNENNASQEMPHTQEDAGSTSEPSGCEYSEQLLAMVPDDEAIDGLGWSITRCVDSGAQAVYREDQDEYVFFAQALEEDSPLLAPYIESMSDAPESILEQLKSAITFNGEMFKSMHDTCVELSETEYLPPEIPTPIVDSGICLMKEDEYWTARKLVSHDLGLLVEYHGESAESLIDAQQAARKLFPLFEKFSVPSQ